MKPLHRRHRPRFPARRWYRKNFVRQPEQEQQWIRYVRCENPRRQDLGEDQLESQEFRVGVQPGWFEPSPQKGASGEYQRRSSDQFVPVIGLTSNRLTRCCLRTPVRVKGDIAEGMPLHVSLPRKPGVMREVLRLSLSRIKFSSDLEAGEVVRPK